MMLNHLSLHWWIVCIYIASTSLVEASFLSRNLLNANTARLSALSSPGNFYFLEFPLEDYRSSQLSPICGDGSPYSFAFRRGSDEHISKLLIEFESGPAYWGDGSSSCDVEGSIARKQTPWYDYLKNFQDSVVATGIFPALGTCAGVSPGFIDVGIEFVHSSKTKKISDNSTVVDLPIPLRGDSRDSWWEKLGGNRSNIRDWSYILLPHCSLDWHLGHQRKLQSIPSCSAETQTMEHDAVYHRGGTNVHAVMEWIKTQFPAGLDALVTTAGGKIGGCGGDQLDPETTSSIAPAILAANLAASVTGNNIVPSPSSILVVTEGSGMWNTNLPSHEIMASRWNAIDLPSKSGLAEAMEVLVRSSTALTEYVWMASREGKTTEKEKNWLKSQKAAQKGKFHVYEPSSESKENEEELNWCPLYSFPDDANADFSDFFYRVIENMAWSSSSASSVKSLSSKDFQNNDPGGDDETGFRLTFLSIFIIMGGTAILVWVIYYIVKYNRTQNGKSPPLSPSDLWFIALTKYPLVFLFFSLLIPILLSLIVFARSGGINVNLDFNSYLNIDTDLENIKRSYNKAQEYQRESLKTEEWNCFSLGRALRTLRSDEDSLFGNRKLLEEMGLDIEVDRKVPFHELSSHQRELNAGNNFYSGGETISIMYQNRNGGNVFEPDVLKAIYEFELSIYRFPGFRMACDNFFGACMPIDSLVPHFFKNGGEIVSNRDTVLRSFLGDQSSLWKLDQYFGPGNLKSNVIRSFVHLRNMQSFYYADQRAVYPFMESFYRDFLWKNDQEKVYPAMVHTWANNYLEKVEANDALNHDTLWSIGALLFVAFMISLKVQSIFLVVFSMLGLILSFSVSYYWVSVHFSIENITLLWVAGIFVMLGIGADDIFLMVDSFEHTQIEFQERNRIVDADVSNVDDDVDDQEMKNMKLDILGQRMKLAYSRAGSMMLVSSVTTAICFFSNAFGVLTVVQEFGYYLGMVVLINYVHVMTILPSAILVNEIYVAPLQKKCVRWWKPRHEQTSETDAEKYAHSEEEDAEKGLSNGSREGDETLENAFEKVSEMNSLDRYLVETYAPFVNQKSKHLLLGAVVMAIFLGICGTATFHTTDGNIVLFSQKFNLGRLSVVNNLYFNDDISKTIEMSPDKESKIKTDGGDSSITGGTELVSFPVTSAPIIFDDKDVDSGALNVGLTVSNNGNGGTVPNNGNGGTGSNTVPNNGNGGTGSNNGNGGTGSTPQQQGSQSDNNGVGNSINIELSGSEPSNQESNNNGSANQGSNSNGSANQGSNSNGSAPQQEASFPENYGGSSYGGDPLVISVPEMLGLQSDAALGRRETIHVKLIWGVEPVVSTSNLWIIDNVPNTKVRNDELASSSTFDLTEPRIQGWLLEVAETAKKDTQLFIRQDKITWIEILRDFASVLVLDFQGSNSNGSAPQQEASFPENYGGSSYGGDPLVISVPEMLGLQSDAALGRRETIHVKLIWGVEPVVSTSNLWIIDNVPNTKVRNDELASSSTFDLTEPRIQGWLLEVVETAKKDTQLHIRQDKITWIEILRDFAIGVGVGFPIPKHLFTGYLQLLKQKNDDFADLIKNEIGTSSPGLGGQFTFASITMMVDAVQVGKPLSENVYKKWSEFTEKMNKSSPSDAAKVIAQSRVSLDAYRVEAIIDSTLVTWFVANGLCLLVILLFTQNIALSFMVMVTIILILFCLGGLLFAIFRMPFGPIEALGVSIFIGLSANYSLHVVHAYHHSKSNERKNKIKEAIFAVGSPIVASAVSTMGASAFLFGCRTWVFIELGILICTITAMALLYSMAFLFAWLSIAGPLPFDSNGHESHNRLHRWDIRLLCWMPCQKAFTELRNDNKSESTSSTVLQDLPPGKNEREQSKQDDYSVSLAKNNKTVSSIGIVYNDKGEEEKE
eukprot:CAMPEP_0194349088 /NCGR_PEP_ID=MMETSP0171-20130528/106891_1 /TAXON_ID=218684 /ORGANISM="Corethron pennatum, Strain L29A3" /LENGTH=1903 /DNA_ID=CAMNT_0039116497 /DNA_START=220 /DNA_END=5932 /DNA_ORIENTATION=+